MEQKVNETFLDLRLLKDDALREAANFGPPSTPSRKGGNKPFQRLIALQDRKSTRLNSSHSGESRMPSSA